jgi:hypothetical protein
MDTATARSMTGSVFFCSIKKYSDGVLSFSNSLMDTATARSMTGSGFLEHKEI